LCDVTFISGRYAPTFRIKCCLYLQFRCKHFLWIVVLYVPDYTASLSRQRKSSCA